MGIFLLGSIGAIFAWNVGSLIVCRVIQGAGGAVFPLSFAIINDEFPRERRGSAIGIVSSVLAAALAVFVTPRRARAPGGLAVEAAD